jgi:hypothetical protein
LVAGRPLTALLYVMQIAQPRGTPGGRIGVQQKVTGQQNVEVALNVVGQQKDVGPQKVLVLL